MISHALLTIVVLATVTSDESSGIAKALQLANWDESRFAKFVDGEPLSVDEQAEVERLMQRLSMFDRRLIERSTSLNVTADQLVNDPKSYRGRIVDIRGAAVAYDQTEFKDEGPTRLGTGATLVLSVQDQSGTLLVTAPDVPDAWLQLEKVNQPVACRGVFVKLTADKQGQPLPLVVAPHVAWFPTSASPPAVNYGMSVLGNIGADVSMLDEVQQRKPLGKADTLAFYEVLQAVQSTGAGELVQWAERHLPHHLRIWELSKQQSTDPQQQALAAEVLKRGEDELYSVAPYFNEPHRHVGQLAVFDGVVRRAVRIVTDDDMRSCGVDYYFEIDLYTDDSQNFPLVFCVLELPDGFPTGENLNEPVRVAGFFFKSWRIGTRREGDDRLRTFPLFIGRAPLQIVAAEKSSSWGWVAGFGFVTIVAVIWLVQWRAAQSDRKFTEQTLARIQEPPEPMEFDNPLDA